MWNKTKQILMERLTDSLKKRVRYKFEVYTTNKCHWWSEAPVFYIYVDDERWFLTKLYYYLLKEAKYLHENIDRSLLHHEYWEAHTKAGSAACAYASKYGFIWWTIFPMSWSGFGNLFFSVLKVRGFIAGRSWIVNNVGWPNRGFCKEGGSYDSCTEAKG